MCDTMDVDRVMSALRMARDARPPTPGMIFHLHHGGQCASDTCYAELVAHRMLASMSGKGDGWDIREDARRAICRYIRLWHNRKWRRFTLGYVSPTKYEAQLMAAA